MQDSSARALSAYAKQRVSSARGKTIVAFAATSGTRGIGRIATARLTERNRARDLNLAAPSHSNDGIQQLDGYQCTCRCILVL